VISAFFFMVIRCLKPTVIRYRIVESTNSIALKLASQGADPFTVVQADRQTEGRGRGDHSFFSPEGGLYMSLLLYPEMSPELLPCITLIAGLACAEAVENIAHVSPGLKWPNDLYLNSQKLAGILTETGSYSIQQKKIPYVVVGIGMNLNSKKAAFPDHLQSQIITLHDLTGRNYNLVKFISVITFKLEKLLYQFYSDKISVIERWRLRDILLDKKVKWQLPDGTDCVGFGKGLLDDGRYLVHDLNDVGHQIIGGCIVPVSASI